MWLRGSWTIFSRGAARLFAVGGGGGGEEGGGGVVGRENLFVRGIMVVRDTEHEKERGHWGEGRRDSAPVNRSRARIRINEELRGSYLR